MTNLIVITKLDLETLVARTLLVIQSENTRKNYASILRRFLKSERPLNRAGVIEFINGLEAHSTKLLAIPAMRKLTYEAYLAGAITMAEKQAINDFTIPSMGQTRLGHWLSLEGCRRLMSLPNKKTLIGSRDLAILAMTLGCGLRRAEAASATWEQYVYMEGRALLRDIVGKRLRIRTVPVPDWAAKCIDHWRDMLTLKLDPLGYSIEGPILRNMHQARDPVKPITDHAIALTIDRYSLVMGTKFTPHDLRRTLAQLMRRAGAPIEQIQFTLGHSGVATTERYLGGAIEIGAGKAAVDLIDWNL